MKNKPHFSKSSSIFFQKLTKFVYLVTATNFWFEDVKLPNNFVKSYNTVSKFIETVMIVFMISGFGAIYTQENLSKKQSTNILLKSASGLFMYTMYGFSLYNKETIKQLLFSLTVTLKDMYNDKIVKKMMLKIRMYMAGLTVFGWGAMGAYGVQGAFYALTSNATFTTIIPIWPDIEDRRLVAGFSRILIFIIWLISVAHIMAVYSLVISISICLGYQFSNLYEYFINLNNIFIGKDSHEYKEKKYEDAIKVGIKMHNIILKCVDQLQSSCKVVYSGQILMNVWVTLLLMIQMMQTDRSLMQLAPLMVTATGVLVTSGFLIWSAGDITHEVRLFNTSLRIPTGAGLLPGNKDLFLLLKLGAISTLQAARLPTAMFHSGWHNCSRHSSMRVRKMFTLAMTQAQQVVVIKGFGIIELSHESYVAIVKLSYSVYSVIY